MNLFFLDDDIDLCAEYHIDKHVGKMQLEATQLLSTALWCDRLFGFVPRALNSDELAEIKSAARAEPAIDERTFTRYLPCHHNHPSAIWVRSSLEHFYWTINYVNALESERLSRGYKKPHDSCKECNRLPFPTAMRNTGFVRPTPAMPPELVSGDIVNDYRLFYMLDKAAIPATWKNTQRPFWWDDDIALYHKRYTDMTPAERRQTGWLK